MAHPFDKNTLVAGLTEDMERVNSRLYDCAVEMCKHNRPMDVFFYVKQIYELEARTRTIVRKIENNL